MTRTLTLTLSLLLASTSLSSAGFVWRTSDGATVNDAAAYEQQIEESSAQPQSDSTGRAWQAQTTSQGVAGKAIAANRFNMNNGYNNEAFPTVPSGTEIAGDGTAVELSTGNNTEPMTLGAVPGVDGQVVLQSEGDSYTQVADASLQMQLAPGAQAVLVDNTVMSEPVYSKGDRPASAQVVPNVAPVAEAAPVPTGYAPVPQGYSPQPTPNQPVELAPVPGNTVQQQNAPISLITGRPLQSEPMRAPVPLNTGTMMSAPSTPVLEGFGKQVPLVVALRQILPESYSFAHRDGVDLSAPVDWQGGRPWPEVLNAALAPLGLSAVITADTVLIEPNQQQARFLPDSVRSASAGY